MKSALKSAPVVSIFSFALFFLVSFYGFDLVSVSNQYQISIKSVSKFQFSTLEILYPLQIKSQAFFQKQIF